VRRGGGVIGDVGGGGVGDGAGGGPAGSEFKVYIQADNSEPTKLAL